MAEKYDIVVVGAGPAGSAAAYTAARAGLQVLVVERRSRIGSPVRCGEYAPAGLSREVPQIALPVAQKISRLVLHLPSGQRHDLASPGLILDRGPFDRRLAEAAVEAGAELWTHAPVVKVEGNGRLTIDVDGSLRHLRGRLVIGADGPRSKVAVAIGLSRPKVMMGLQRTVELQAPLQEAHLYFWKHCIHGYGWLFPKGETANLGVALPRGEGRRAHTAIAELSRSLAAESCIPPTSADDAERGDPGRSGLIPCSGPLPRLAAGRFLLVGDAAGQTDALTGAGIVAAVRAGTMAGEAAAKAARAGRLRAAGVDYEIRWRRALGRAAARAAERRFELEARWSKDVERAVKTSWLSHDIS